MKKLFLVSALVAVCGVVNAADAVTSYAVPQMVSEINAAFVAMTSTSAVGKVAVLEATSVTNATLTQQKADITATAAVTKQTYVPTFLLADGTTNTTAIVTNATVAVTVVNGSVVVTNVSINLIRQ